MTFVVEGLLDFPPDAVDVFARFTGEFADIELPVVEASGLGLAGAWQLDGDGGHRRLLHLYGPIAGLADLTASARWIAKLPADHPYLGLYSWLTGAGIRYARTVRPMVPPVDRAWWQDRTGAPAPAPYLIATCRYGITGERTVRPALTAAVAALGDLPGTRVVLAYDTLFGEYGATRLICTAPDRAAFAEALEAHTAATASERDPWTVVPATPMAYSPLD